MDIKEIYKLYLETQLISTDTRNIIPNGLFFALKGSNFNGNEFSLEAINKGASYSIIDEEKFAKHPKCILVEDVLKTLQDLANYHRKQLTIPVIGITGTNGKTTSKELLYAVLNSTYKTFATKGNLNNHIGVPLSLLSITSEHQMAIIEMGANHVGEIDFLCRIAEPDFGIITNIGKAHLEGFGGFEGVIKTKTELYRFINEKKGVLFVNAENELLKTEAAKVSCKKVYYGNDNESLVSGNILNTGPYFTIQLQRKAENVETPTQLAGAYNKENVLAAACAGTYFNIPLNTISKAISNYEPGNNRSQLKETKKNLLLCDYYNANPSSMEAALQNFNAESFSKKKKVVMLGEMKELGSESAAEHEKVIDMLLKMDFTEIFLAGKEFCNIQNEGIKYFENSELLADYLKKNEINDAVVLIKGSRGSRMEAVLPYL